jgi:signal transduction histidine kinase
VVELEKRLPVEVVAGPDVRIQADGDQLEQLLINLIQNAVEAALETNGKVSVTWQPSASHLEVLITDEGPGIANPGNLFVPFFTTKANGSGIGLVLSRQIAEAHKGRLSLQNRDQGPGCVARLALPMGTTRHA